MSIQTEDIQIYEQKLKDIDCDFERMSILDRQSRTCLQIVHRKGLSFIRSSNDMHRELRLMIFELLIKIYSIDTVQNKKQLMLFKNVVYSSQLNSFVTSRGLMKQQLQKNIAIQLQKLSFGSSIELQLLKCFNCVSFYDEVVMASFEEYFQPKRQKLSWDQVLAEHFNVEFVDMSFNQSHQTEMKNTISIEYATDGVFLASTIAEQEEGSKDSILEDITDHVQQREKKQRLLTVSVDEESPLGKENLNESNFIVRSAKISPFVTLTSTSRRKNEKRSSFWSMLCCGVE